MVKGRSQPVKSQQNKKNAVAVSKQSASPSPLLAAPTSIGYVAMACSKDNLSAVSLVWKAKIALPQP